jgi:cyclopropane fatty-acyl-phospholipid synthase-like methyltransferase
VLDAIYNGDLGNFKTWLDVGCGHGEFMTAVKKYSREQFSIKGTEPNVKKQESARKRGLDVGYFDLESHQEKYDIISMLNVYSHLPDPPAFLNQLRRLLNNGGEILLETGDSAGLSAEDHHRPFYLPDHLSFASESIIVGILERLDFEVLKISKFPLCKPDLENILREVAKAFLPKYETRLHYYFNWKKYSQIDMFVRARLKS